MVGEIVWPFASAALDGEVVAGDGREGIQSVFSEGNRIGGDLAFLAFDVLEMDGTNVIREPWRDRRKGLGDLFGAVRLPRVGIVPVT